MCFVCFRLCDYIIKLRCAHAKEGVTDTATFYRGIFFNYCATSDHSSVARFPRVQSIALAGLFYLSCQSVRTRYVRIR